MKIKKYLVLETIELLAVDDNLVEVLSGTNGVHLEADISNLLLGLLTVHTMLKEISNQKKKSQILKKTSDQKLIKTQISALLTASMRSTTCERSPAWSIPC